jgi:hypothetical protein
MNSFGAQDWLSVRNSSNPKVTFFEKQTGFTEELFFDRNGAGPKGFFGSLSQYMLASGATFAFVRTDCLRTLTLSPSFFMSIGTVIRTDDGLEYTPRRALLQGPNLPPVTYELLRRQRERQAS